MKTPFIMSAYLLPYYCLTTALLPALYSHYRDTPIYGCVTVPKVFMKGSNSCKSTFGTVLLGCGKHGRFEGLYTKTFCLLKVAAEQGLKHLSIRMEDTPLQAGEHFVMLGYARDG
jgi:hypothetical protein